MLRHQSRDFVTQNVGYHARRLLWWSHKKKLPSSFLLKIRECRGDNGVLYEQVLVVNVFPYQGLCFCCCRCVCCCSPPGLYSHSDESDESGLGADWGSRGESMLRFIRRPWRAKTPTQSSERGVGATGELYAAC
jgi:hypothetical protein